MSTNQQRQGSIQFLVPLHQAEAVSKLVGRQVFVRQVRVARVPGTNAAASVMELTWPLEEGEASPPVDHTLGQPRDFSAPEDD